MEQLPAELHVAISSYLPPMAIANLALTNRYLFNMYGTNDAYRSSLLTRSIIRIIEEDLPFCIRKKMESMEVQPATAVHLLHLHGPVTSSPESEEWSKLDDDAKARCKKRTDLILDLGKKNLKGFLLLTETNMRRWVTKKIFWELIYSLIIQHYGHLSTRPSLRARRTSTPVPSPTWLCELDKDEPIDTRARIFKRIVEQSGEILLSKPEKKNHIHGRFLCLLGEPADSRPKQLLLLACKWLSVEMVELLLSVEIKKKWHLQTAINFVVESAHGTSEKNTQSRNRILKALTGAGKKRPLPTAWHNIWQLYYKGDFADPDSDMLMYKTIKTLFEIGTPIDYPEHIARVFRWVLDKMTHGSFTKDGTYVKESFWVGKQLLDILLNKAHVDPNLPLQRETVETGTQNNGTTPSRRITYIIRPLHYALLKLNERSPGIEANLVKIQDYLLRNSQLAFAIFCLVLCGADPTASRVDGDHRCGHKSGKFTSGRMIDAFTPIEMAACLGPFAERILQIMLGVKFNPTTLDALVIEHYTPRKVLLCVAELYDCHEEYTKEGEVNVGYGEITPTHKLKPHGEFVLNELMAPNKFSNDPDLALPRVSAVVSRVSGTTFAHPMPHDLVVAFSDFNPQAGAFVPGQPINPSTPALDNSSLDASTADGSDDEEEDEDIEDEVNVEVPAPANGNAPPLNVDDPFAPVVAFHHNNNGAFNFHFPHQAQIFNHWHLQPPPPLPLQPPHPNLAQLDPAHVENLTLAQQLQTEEGLWDGEAEAIALSISLMESQPMDLDVVAEQQMEWTQG
ncbi:hypothetical protein BJ508DRAFT_428 [Ascobolus immersus RN42]|uniref:F-box domain-containing protein n=1 Tax=Ascobolus immersus RN42 TaxID=1160509 RepID=A0A3N4IQ60_ASCIM|nr:hypothetical protein BJ508DRAFT_428 [Ascobolus immersus RN42]